MAPLHKHYSAIYSIFLGYYFVSIFIQQLDCNLLMESAKEKKRKSPVRKHLPVYIPMEIIMNLLYHYVCWRLAAFHRYVNGHIWEC